MGANVKGATVVVLDCPDISFFSALCSSPLLRDALQRADLVFHMTEASLFCSEAYEGFIKQHASPNCTHYALNQCCPQGSIFRCASTVQNALHEVAPVFAIPSEQPRKVFVCPSFAKTINIGDCHVLAPRKSAGFEECSVRPSIEFNTLSKIEFDVPKFDNRKMQIGYHVSSYSCSSSFCSSSFCSSSSLIFVEGFLELEHRDLQNIAT